MELHDAQEHWLSFACQLNYSTNKALAFFAYTLLLALICVNNVNAQTTAESNEGYYHYLGNYPENRNNGWHQNLQGIDHDETHWFITQTDVIWRIPGNFDLNRNVTASTPGVIRRSLDDFSRLSGYNHLGDLDYAGRLGVLAIPLEGPGMPPAIGWFHPKTLDYLGHTNIPGQDKAPWFAFDPEGRLYTSASNTSSTNRYSVSWSRLLGGEAPTLEFDRVISMLDEQGQPLNIEAMQGGEFSPSGELLYLVSGYYKDVDRHAEGIHVLQMSGRVWQRIRHSTNGSGSFNYEFHPGGPILNPINEEPEGLTIWDLDDGPAPNIDGQLHVIMLDNDENSDDDLYFKHYAINSRAYVDAAYRGNEPQGTLIQPYPTISEAVTRSEGGTEIRIRAGSYPETLRVVKPARLSATAGRVVIGAP